RTPPPSTLFPYTTLFRSHPALPVEDLAALGWGDDRPHLLALGARDQIGAADELEIREARFDPDGPEREPSCRDERPALDGQAPVDRKSTRLNSSHVAISY